MCFELLGFDVILDDTIKPYILEVNYSPSLETGSKLDKAVKRKVIEDTFLLVTAD